MTIEALIEAGKKARDTGEREAILEYGKLSFHTLPEIEELVEWVRDEAQHAKGCSGEFGYPYKCGLDRIREIVGGGV